MNKTFTFALILLLPISTFAATPKRTDYTRMYDQCLRKAGAINNSSVAVCSESVSTATKTEMNALYKHFYDRLSTESAENAVKFESAQKSWLSYRNAHCALAGEYVGSPMYSYCPMQLNIQRVKELRELAGE